MTIVQHLFPRGTRVAIASEAANLIGFRSGIVDRVDAPRALVLVRHETRRCATWCDVSELSVAS